MYDDANSRLQRERILEKVRVKKSTSQSSANDPVWVGDRHVPSANVEEKEGGGGGGGGGWRGGGKKKKTAGGF